MRYVVIRGGTKQDRTNKARELYLEAALGFRDVTWYQSGKFHMQSMPDSVDPNPMRISTVAADCPLIVEQWNG